MPQTLTELRASVDRSDARHVAEICKMFAEIARSNPELVEPMLSRWMRASGPIYVERHIDLLADTAEGLAHQFSLPS